MSPRSPPTPRGTQFAMSGCMLAVRLLVVPAIVLVVLCEQARGEQDPADCSYADAPPAAEARGFVAQNWLRLRVLLGVVGDPEPEPEPARHRRAALNMCIDSARPHRPKPSEDRVPEIWRVVSDAAYDQLPQRTTPEFSVVLGVMMVHGPSDSVPGVAVEGEF